MGWLKENLLSGQQTTRNYRPPTPHAFLHRKTDPFNSHELSPTGLVYTTTQPFNYEHCLVFLSARPPAGHVTTRDATRTFIFFLGQFESNVELLFCVTYFLVNTGLWQYPRKIETRQGFNFRRPQRSAQKRVDVFRRTITGTMRRSQAAR